MTTRFKELGGANLNNGENLRAADLNDSVESFWLTATRQHAYSAIRQASDRAIAWAGVMGEMVDSFAAAGTGRYSLVSGSNTAYAGGSHSITSGSVGSVVYTLVPAGSFVSNIGQSILIPSISKWESGNDITYKYVSDVGSYWMLIIASSLTPSDFAINNCKVIPINTGSWILYSTAATIQDQRANIYQTLFYGSDGSNPRIGTSYIGSLTALRTNYANDVGKNFYTVSFISGGGAPTGSVVGSFTNTTTNTDCMFWYSITDDGGTATGFDYPAGTNIVNVSGTTVTGSVSKTNQLHFKLYGETTTGTSYVVVGCAGSFTTTKTGDTTLGSSDWVRLGSQVAIGSATETFTLQDSGWLAAGSAGSLVNFTPFTLPPNKIEIKLTPKGSSPTAGYPGVTGFWLLGRAR